MRSVKNKEQIIYAYERKEGEGINGDCTKPRSYTIINVIYDLIPLHYTLFASRIPWHGNNGSPWTLDNAWLYDL